MRQTIDFKKWLKGPSRPRTSYDLYALWRASCGKSEGSYQGEAFAGPRLLIIGPGNEALFLPSGKAIGAFKIALEASQVEQVCKEVWGEIEDPKPAPFNIKLTVPASRRFKQE